MTVTKSAAEALGLTTGGAEVISETVTTSPGTEVAKVKTWTDEDLLNVTPESIGTMFAQKGLEVTDAGALGNGFTLLKSEEKTKLLGVDMFILEWQKRIDLDTNGEFYSLMVLTRDGKKYIVNDGSTGIAAQLDVAVARGITAPLRVAKGLRVSEYPVEVDGRKTMAKTFYLDTTPAS